MLLRIFAKWRITILVILISIFSALAVALVNLEQQGQQVSLDHVKAVRVIGDNDNKILKVPVDAAILDGNVYVVDSGALKVKVFSDRGEELFEFQGTRWYDVKGAKLEAKTEATEEAREMMNEFQDRQEKMIDSLLKALPSAEILVKAKL